MQDKEVGISVKIKRKHEENDNLLNKKNSKKAYMRMLVAYKIRN